MCGIAGIFSIEGIAPTEVFRMSRKMAHRGPDGEGFVFFREQESLPFASDHTPENCIGSGLPYTAERRSSEWPQNVQGGMAHRRLSIIDLEATGHQPMCSANKRYWITFNGEIYNYIELRKELQQKGCVFITQSDTEVILHAFEQWGESCLQRFNGMWAFCIYDTHQQRVFAARDRFGVKPFYYSIIGKQFAFASEQKSLLSLKQLSIQLNAEAVFDYFVFSQIEYQPQGFLEGILELPAGALLHFDVKSGKCKTRTWYQLPINHEQVKWEKSVQDAHIERIQTLMSDAIRLRLRADVPVGSCLSGGLDSSAIVGWMRHHLGPNVPLHVYTAVFPGLKVDEGNWAKQMAESVNALQHRVEPTSDELLRDMEALSYCQDVPIWSTSTYAQFRVMQLVKESGIKVVLDGQGGDEVFGGYAPHRSFYWKGLSLREKLNAMKMEAGLKSNVSFHLHQQARYAWANQLPSGIASSFYKSYFPENGFLNAEFYAQQSNRFALQGKIQQYDLNDRLGYEMQNTSLKGYLKCEDRCAMWHSIESRTPFADDPALIEYVFSIPAVYKMHDARMKSLLREAAVSVLPQSIYQRSDKQGYTTPNNDWIRKIAPHFKEHFNDSLGTFLDVKKIQKEYSALFNPKGDADTGRIFKFISFAVWMKTLQRAKD